MTIENVKKGNELTLTMVGRLDTTTAPQLERETEKSLKEIKALILDMEGLEYLSSAGLRVILLLQKKMNQQGTMVVRNVNEAIMEVFEITGFVDILNIQ